MRVSSAIFALIAVIGGIALAGFIVQRDRYRLPAPVPSAASNNRIAYPAAKLPTLVLPNGEARTIRSVLNVRRMMRFGDYLWDEAGVPAGPTWVRVDLSRQTLSVFRAGHEIGSTVIIFGTDGKPTPVGIFPILAMSRVHASSLYDAEMPYMLRLTGDGVAIHASHILVGSATHGCIGVPPAFAALLFDHVHVGDTVAILPT